MASATSLRQPRRQSKRAAVRPGPIPEARALEPSLRALAHARQVAPLLYFELTGLDGAGSAGPTARRLHAACSAAVSRALRGAVGSLLRRKDAVVRGPEGRWFAALLLDRAVAARERSAVSDADLGVAAGRLRAAIQTGLSGMRASARAKHGATPRAIAPVGVRAGWTIIEPRDGIRPLAEFRHALRGAAVVARIEERRATVFAAITHELRTPLTSILGYAERLSGGEWRKRSARERALEIMSDEARRLARLTEGLIDAGAWQTGKLALRLQPVRLREIALRASSAVSEPARARGVRIVLRGDAGATADPDRLLQVMVNLLDNAVRHARKGGAVRIALSRTRSGRAIVITDDGSGFDRNELSSLGTPFAAGLGGRTGLGLAICRMLVEAHGGSIAFTCASGGGARVTVRLVR